MQWWQALVLGIVEGVTEYLPVSSTGHLILTSWLMGLDASSKQEDAVYAFNIIIQAGAIAAVLGLYWPRIKQMTLGMMGRDALGLRLALNLLIAFLPAAVLGPLLDDRIEANLNGPWPVVAALFAGGCLMIVVARRHRPSSNPDDGCGVDDVNWKMALTIGVCQCVAMWPGTSRSMMTIVAAVLLGLHAKSAAEFSFLLGLITLTAATGYKALNDGQAMMQTIGVGELAIGFIAATISAALAVKWFVAFLTRHGMAPFGWYRIAIAIAVAALVLGGRMT